MKKLIKITAFFLIANILLMGCEFQPSRQNEQKIERFGSLIKVRPEFEERYIILHKHTFPGVLDRIHKSNIRNYSIFLKDGILFSYFEYTGDDYEGDMAKIGKDTVTREWWKLTDPMQEPLETRKEGEWWASMEEIFHHGEKQVPSPIEVRYAYIAQIKAGVEKELVSNFKKILQDVLKEIKQANIQNYSLYLKDERLYAYFEYIGKDFKTDIEGLTGSPEIKEWQNQINSLLEPISIDQQLVYWTDLKEVFHTD